MSIISVCHYNSRLNDAGALNYTFQEVEKQQETLSLWNIWKSTNVNKVDIISIMHMEIKFKSYHMGAKFGCGTE